MNLQNLINGRLGVGLALFVSRITPPGPAYSLVNLVTRILARQENTSLVKSLLINQWVVNGADCTRQELDQCVWSVLRNTGRHIYDFYHNLHNDQKIDDLVIIDSSFQKWLENSRNGTEPAILVAPHQSNFDLMARGFLLKGGKFQVLSYPQPNAGYRWQNRLREHPNMQLTPMSIDALRQASVTLRANGTVVTGVDRPLPDSDGKYRPRFFGRPATMPVFHIRLALKHDLPIVVICAQERLDGKLAIIASEPIPMKRHSDLHKETVDNAEAILAVIEEYIRPAPEQWAMFYPVWPDVQAELPAA